MHLNMATEMYQVEEQNLCEVRVKSWFFKKCNRIMFSDNSRFYLWADDGGVCWKFGKRCEIEFWLKNDTVLTQEIAVWGAI